ncbi:MULTISPECIES: ABC transporter ATP-binding protein [unclassified Phyllobacterium]|uniref:ABC transporter ATP-binding protein n=1 Tax=unclassified Phyllobacterium TaxID=2638441 RepID=UPI003012B9E4
MKIPLLDVRELSVSFPGRGAFPIIRAVDKVTFTLERGKTLGLVGESGCGKSTTGYALLRLTKASAGSAFFDGVDLLKLSKREMRDFRQRVQIIFQDAAASLDPRMSIGDLIGKALEIHGLAKGRQRLPRIRQLLDIVGIPSHFIQRFPHELSGGQAQRIAICRALAVQPSIIICDEPVSALDVSIQAQIINLLQSLQKEFGISYLFISHDMSVVKHISDNIAVMYLGRIVEQASRDKLFSDPRHPYTRALLSAVPVPDPDIEQRRERIVLQGDLPSPADLPSGCRFRTRCPQAGPECALADPIMRKLGEEQYAACVQL